MEPHLSLYGRRNRASTLWLLRVIATISLSAFSVSTAKATRSNETDMAALLAIKANIIDPLGVLSSWNSSHHFCQWFGVTCGLRHPRVTKLELYSRDLSGTISPHIGNLSFLRVLNLKNNSFHSVLPLEVGHLSRLQLLVLPNNSFTGPIPPSLTLCSNLVNIDIRNNMLLGHLPAGLSSLSKLKEILLGNNHITGQIPLSFGNLSSLESLELADNQITGRIPDTFSNLRNLKGLYLEGNGFVGGFPLSVTNISSLETLDLSDNQFMGALPLDFGVTLPNLTEIAIFDNQFSGPIPTSISNMSQLSNFQFGSNNFTGDVPSFGKMRNLYRFYLGECYLGSGRANDVDFLCSLTNSTNLYYLDIAFNNFGGVMPRCIGNLSITIGYLFLQKNAITGTLPGSIRNLINLEFFLLSYNNFSGRIPPEIGNLSKMKMLYLGSCGFTGEIPHTLGNLSLLTHLALQRNALSGTITSTLGGCRRLLAIDVSHNNLSGAIPPEVMSLSSLSIVADFSRNNLSGEIPVEIGNLKNVAQLDLDGNKFTGDIPGSLGECTSLEYLSLEENMLTGPIPFALSSLKGLQMLNLSHNKLSGQIPGFLENLNLSILDLSFNYFEGYLPVEGVFTNTSATTVVGNEKLCGGIPEYQLPRCKSGGRSIGSKARMAFICIGAGIFATIIVLLLVYFLWTRKPRKTVASSGSTEGFLKVSYQDLLKATDGFSAANLIGSGSFGSVFKGVLPTDQTTIAVKVLNLDRHGASKSFDAECEALRKIRHRNLVKVLTACSGSDYQGNDFKALVYEFMANGSLDEWLHPPVDTEARGEQGNVPRQLSLVQRVNIAIDVASALDYLHHQCETPIVHCDLKPSNVLINDEMTGHVGDFGLVRFMPEATRELISNPTSSIGVKGSLGYIAPEYGAGAEASINGDVYSYGILILEMFTGKRPTDDLFTDGLNLHSYAKASFPEGVLQIIDPELINETKLGENSDRDNRRSRRSHEMVLKIQESLVSIMEIGMTCSSEVPRDRMNMKNVAAAMQAIRKKLD